jgi:ferredoxin, 2Fe-2S
MPLVIYVESNGTQHSVEVPVGLSVMQGALNHSIEGIVAECGGACACATCHVLVDLAWLELLEPMNQIEDDMLDCAEQPRTVNSRLSCQLVISPDLDGLVIRVP